MKYVTFADKHGQTRAGVLSDDMILAYPPGMTLIDVIATRSTGYDETLPRTDVRLMAPIQRPGKILCIGRNYADHAAELGNTMPTSPLIFAKFATTLIGPGDAVRWRTSITQQVDWEGELVVVIGRAAQDVPEDSALDYVFGYTIANDISARDLQDTENQWTRAKASDTFCPLGPVVVSRDEVDPHALNLRTLVNGETMQAASTSLMYFRVPYLVSYLSRTFTLEPGDLILTGTPAGVGKGMKPPRFLKDGDQVEVIIEGIGALANPCMTQD